MRLEKHMLIIVFIFILLISLIVCINSYILVQFQINENQEENEIKITHAMIIKSQENIAKQLQCDLYDECWIFPNN